MSSGQKHDGLDLTGFEPPEGITVEDLYKNKFRNISRNHGIYVVLRFDSMEEPGEKSTGGEFNGKDPTCRLDDVLKKWQVVSNTEVLYIGKATNLRNRISKLIRFGKGEPSSHYGGRLLWHINNNEKLLVRWKALAHSESPKAFESIFQMTFRTANRGHLPFANMRTETAEQLLEQPKLDGNSVLSEAAKLLNIDLCKLVAGSAYWAPNKEDVVSPKYPDMRRARKGELRGKSADGVRFDDNTYANKALKSALSHVGKFTNFEVCHIWPKTCYDVRYHTVLANLVLLPRALASLTDHNDDIKKCLKYRSYDLYNWHPEDETRPEKPDNYPLNWLQPIVPRQKSARTSARKTTIQSLGEMDILKQKLKGWSKNKDLKVFKIIALLHAQSSKISREKFVDLIEKEKVTGNGSGAVRSLSSNSGNNYGKILRVEDGFISIRSDLKGTIEELWPVFRN